jgi:hypothetical protein
MDHYGVGMECRIDEALVHYVEHGGGVPLVALHGAGVDHREIEGALEAVVPGTGYRRIYPDLPGMGLDNRRPYLQRRRGDAARRFYRSPGAGSGDAARALLRRLPGSWRGRTATRHGARFSVVVHVAERSTNVPGHDVVRQYAEAYVELEPEQRAGFEEYFVVRTPATARRYRDHVAPGTTLVDRPRHGAATCTPPPRRPARAAHIARTRRGNSRPLPAPADLHRQRCTRPHAASGETRPTARTRSRRPGQARPAARTARTATPRQAAARQASRRMRLPAAPAFRRSAQPARPLRLSPT